MAKPIFGPKLGPKVPKFPKIHISQKASHRKDSMTVPQRHFPKGQLIEGEFTEGKFPEPTIHRTNISRTDSSPNDISPNGHFLERTFRRITFFFISLNPFYHWPTKTAEATEFQQKSISTNNKLNVAVKLTYLQIKHPQSVFSYF